MITTLAILLKGSGKLMAPKAQSKTQTIKPTTTSENKSDTNAAIVNIKLLFK